MRKFKKIYVEITNVCNLKCDFCPETKRNAEFMTENTFSKILEQIKPFTEYIYLHIKGEPLLHPNLERFLDISNEQNFKVNITTNGVLIGKLADILIKKPAMRQINFSLHSYDGNKNNVIKDTYINDILNFTSRAIIESNIIVVLRLWNLDEDLLTEDQRQRNISIIHRIEEYFSLSYKIKGHLSENKALKLNDRVYLDQDYEFKWPDLKEKEDFKPGTCFGLRKHIGILVDGTVVPCCLDGEGVINLGNIHEHKFSEIINRKRAQAIKIGFCNNKVVEELCRKCGYRKRFTPANN